jgi:hypothetical protein
MKKNTFALIICGLALSACSSRPQEPAFPAPDPLPDSVVWNDDPELAPLLRRSAFGVNELNAAERVALFVGPMTFVDRLSAVAEDTSAPAVVRINALNLLAHGTHTSELFAFSSALRAREERVRMAAVSGMRDFLPAAPTTAIAILEQALRDPNPRIQARALEILSDRDVDVLRAYLARGGNTELRGIALNLLRTAEERGAPLVAKDSLGTLERITPTGVTITFRPTQRWPQWDAAVGELFITLPKAKQATRVAANVEVVDNVVPAFVTADTTALVYETNREIHVRDLRTGTDTKLADGVAPRLLPFSNDVIFFREQADAGLSTPTDVPYRYQILRAALAGAPSAIGELKTVAKNQVKGNYSPVRWIRVREMNGRFYLIGESIKDFELPSPFGN